MSIAGPATTPHHARNPDVGMLLIGLGAILLLISLFLTWYQPEIDAWEAFEVWDLVLAVLAIGALVAVAGRLGFAPVRPASWLLVPAFAALVIVLYAILNPPLGARLGDDGDPSTGLWLALAAAILMTAGAVLSVAHISVAFTAAGRGDHDPGAPGGTRHRGGFAPGAGPGVGEHGGAPVAPGAVAPHGHGGAPVAPGAVPPTEPTRRL